MSSNLLVGAALALTTSLAASGLSPAAAPQDEVDCGFRITVVHVLAELSGDASPDAEKLRQDLIDIGADQPGFVPDECYSGGASTGDSGSGSDTGSGSRSGNDSGSGTGSGPGNGGGSGSGNDSGGGAGTGAGSGAGGSGSKCTTTAADKLGWGSPKVEDDFEGTEVSGDWNMYDGPGHAGNGVRTPDAISVTDGILTITGSENGDAGGMAWSANSQQFGRWEGCAQSPPGAADLHTLFLLWPTAEDWPEGGEVDFMEISDPSRQEVGGFLHYGADNSQTEGTTQVDATEWNAFAVEWTPEKVTYLVNGEPWFEDTDPSHNPPGPMHLTIQLDNFGGDLAGGAEMHVDWVRQYDAEGGETSGGVGAGADVSAGQDGVDAGADVSTGGSGESGSDSSSSESGASGGGQDGRSQNSGGDDGGGSDE